MSTNKSANKLNLHYNILQVKFESLLAEHNLKGEVMEDVEYILLKRVASAVILQALKDLKCDRDSYRFKTARNFCLGTTPAWSDSLSLWCEFADVTAEKVKAKAKAIINATVQS